MSGRPWTIAIDPGKRFSGVAFLDREGGLVAARVLRGCPSRGDSVWARTDLHPNLLADGPVVAIVERPQVYRAGRSRVSPESLVDVAVAAGAWARACSDLGAEVEEVEPAEWKGQLPKEQVHRRAREVLRPEEQRGVQTGVGRTVGALDLWDAISLGLWRVERLRLR